MKLKRSVSDLAEVDDKFHGLYKAGGDGFVLIDLDIEGQGDDKDTGDDNSKELKAKLSEFRNRNNRLMTDNEQLKQDMAELKAKFDGVDPDRQRKALEALEALENDAEKQLLREGKFDEVFERRTKAMKEQYESEVKALREAREKLKNERDQFFGELSGYKVSDLLDQGLNELKLKVRPGAKPDLVYRASQVWQPDDKGQPKPMRDGIVERGADGDELSVTEWLGKLSDQAPHLFEPGGGGDAGGSPEQRRSSDGKKIIAGSDKEAFAASIDDIADGKVEVRM